MATLRYRANLPPTIEVLGAEDMPWRWVRHWASSDLRRGDDAEPVLRYLPGFVDGRIARGRGSAPLRVHPSFWRYEWTITDAEGAPLVRAVRGLWSCSRGSIEITEAGARLPDVEALCYLGWIMGVRWRRHVH